MSRDIQNEVVQRLNKMGLCTDEISTANFCSATSALTCFPMYFVGSAIDLGDDQDKQAALRDLIGIGALRDAFEVGQQQSAFHIDAEHAVVLKDILLDSRPPMYVVHEFALDTLALFLEVAAVDLAELVRMAVARMIVSVASASGSGWFGAGSDPSPPQIKAIDLICQKLGLRDAPTSSVILEELDNLSSQTGAR